MFTWRIKGKTRILVTHQLQYLSAVDKIFVLQNGSIIESGNYQELMKSEGEFARLINNYSIEKQKEEEKKEEKKEEEKEVKKPKESKIVSVEERDVGKIESKVYADYVMSIGGVVLVSLILLVFLMEIGSRVGSDYWLSFWSNDSNLYNHGIGFYLGIYAAWGATSCFMVLTRSLSVAYGGINAARTLHQKVLARVLKAPTSFFDTTPTGIHLYLIFLKNNFFFEKKRKNLE